MTHQFPTGFEFNEKFLLHVVDSLYSGLYGTFLYNSEQERLKVHIWEKTESVWAPVLENPTTFTNQLFQRTTRVLFPRANLKRVVLWEGLYFRWDPEMHPAYVESLDPLSKTQDMHPGTTTNPTAALIDEFRLEENHLSLSATHDRADTAAYLSDASSLSENDDDEYPLSRPAQRRKSMQQQAPPATTRHASPSKEDTQALKAALHEFTAQAADRARERTKANMLRETLAIIPDKSRVKYLEDLLTESVARELQLEAQLGSAKPPMVPGSGSPPKHVPIHPQASSSYSTLGLTTLGARHQLVQAVEQQLEQQRKSGHRGLWFGFVDTPMWLLFLSAFIRLAEFAWREHRIGSTHEQSHFGDLVESLFLFLAAVFNGILNMLLYRRESREVAERVHYAVKVLCKTTPPPAAANSPPLKRDSILAPSSCCVACYRDHKWQSIPMNLLVHGDVVALMSGDVSPGRVRLLPLVPPSPPAPDRPSRPSSVTYARGDKIPTTHALPHDMPRTNATFQPQTILNLCGDMHVYLMEETPVLQDVANSMANVERPRTAVQTLQIGGKSLASMLCLIMTVVILVSIGVRAALLPEPVHHVVNHVCLALVDVILCFVSLHTPFVWCMGEVAATSHLLTAFEAILESEATTTSATSATADDMDVYDVEEREQSRLRKTKRSFAVERSWYWRVHLPSLKPLGLAILLNDCEDPKTEYIDTLRYLSNDAAAGGFYDSYSTTSPQHELLHCVQQLSGYVRHQLLSRGHPSLAVSQCSEYWDGKSICPLTKDKRRLILDMYHQWRVEDLDCVALTYAPVAQKCNALFGPQDTAFTKLPPLFLVEESSPTDDDDDHPQHRGTPVVSPGVVGSPPSSTEALK
ncbi:hypothetical protein B5M09_004147, partial [Aphanomyces astaci]